MSGRRPAATVELVCRTCQQPFTRLKRNVKPGHGGFCSHKCAGILTPRATMVARVCARCQTHFEIPQYQRDRGKGTYCSAACRKNPPPDKAAVRAHKFGQPAAPKKPAKPGSITPKHLDRLVFDNSGFVACARCNRIRERGIRCQCERWTPDGEVA